MSMPVAPAPTIVGLLLLLSPPQRFRRVDYGHREVEITVDDPKAYTKPLTIRLNQRLALDTDLLDYICVENEKDAPYLKAAR